MSGQRTMPEDELLERTLAARAARATPGDIRGRIETTARGIPQTPSRLPSTIAVRRAPVRWAEEGPRRGVAHGRLALAVMVALSVALLIVTAVLVGSRPPDDPPLPRLTSTGDLVRARMGHTATLLADGRVLIVGGSSPRAGYGSTDEPVASAEIWDPASGTFAVTGALLEPRSGHTATLLQDGRVLVVGGDGEDLIAATAEIWDPATGLFTSTGAPTRARTACTATLMADGTVLVVGGRSPDGPTGSIESWDPRTGLFHMVGQMRTPRFGHTATLLPDGRVLIVGGSGDDGVIGSTELFDPASGTSRVVGSLMEARHSDTATELPDGSVLVVGGSASGIRPDLAAAERWDPGTELFGPAGTLPVGREAHTGTLLPDGRVLVAGGLNAPPHGRLAVATEIWDPDTASFGSGPAMQQRRVDHTATLLATGQVLFTGGWTDASGRGQASASAELLDPDAGAPR